LLGRTLSNAAGRRRHPRADGGRHRASVQGTAPMNDRFRKIARVFGDAFGAPWAFVIAIKQAAVKRTVSPRRADPA
jgi:hypothetical protein